MGDPEVSVVMSVFNGADTVRDSIRSILSQEGVSLELVVINDGSTDGTAAILDEVAQQDERVRIMHRQNEGLTCSLIEGCGMARARWIARQDADDLSLPGRLRAQLDRALESDAPVLIGCGAFIRAPEGDVLMVVHPPSEPAAAARRVLVAGQALSPHGSLLFSKAAYAAVGGYRAAFYYAQDIDLTTRLAEYGHISAIPQVLYDYRFSPSAISGSYGHLQRAYYRLIRKGHALRRRGESEQTLLDEAMELREECLRCRNRASSFEGFYFIGTRLLACRSGAAAGYFRKALGIRPWSVKAFIRWCQAVSKGFGEGRQ